MNRHRFLALSALLGLLVLAACASPLFTLEPPPAGAGLAAPAGASPAARPIVAVNLDSPFVGVYGQITPAADSPGRFLALHLMADGAATFSIDFLNELPASIASGDWQDNGDGTATVRLTEQDGQIYEAPDVITFELQGFQLVAIDYNMSFYGSEGLTLQRLNASAVAELSSKQAFIDMNMQAGFALDPFFVSVNGGGDLDIGPLGSKCGGFINPNPVVTLDWEGEAEFAQLFFYSDHDPMLLVQLPSGEYLCNDDARPNLLDPAIQLENPPQGRYNIWVGSYHKGQLIPGVLVLTTQRELSVEAFSLTGWVQRSAVEHFETLTTEQAEIAQSLIREAVTSHAGEIAQLSGEAESLSVALVAEGETAAFELPFQDLLCTGFIEETPDYVFQWTGQADFLRIFFEGDGDGTLLVLTPDDLVYCNDDSLATQNLNPLVEIAGPVPGIYGIFIGRLDTGKPLAGTLTVTGSAGAQPAILQPGS